MLFQLSYSTTAKTCLPLLVATLPNLTDFINKYKPLLGRFNITFVIYFDFKGRNNSKKLKLFFKLIFENILKLYYLAAKSSCPS